MLLASLSTSLGYKDPTIVLLAILLALIGANVAITAWRKNRKEALKKVLGGIIITLITSLIDLLKAGKKISDAIQLVLYAAIAAELADLLENLYGSGSTKTEKRPENLGNSP